MRDAWPLLLERARRSGAERWRAVHGPLGVKRGARWGGAGVGAGQKKASLRDGATNLFVGNYSKRIKENIKRVKRLPKIKGVKEILYPGQRKHRRYKKNVSKQIYIPFNIAEDLKKLDA